MSCAVRLGTVELSTAQHSTPNTCHPRRSQHTAGGRRALRSAAARAPCTCRRPRRAAGPPGASQGPSLVSAAAQTSWSASACCVAPLQQSRDVLLSYGINPTRQQRFAGVKRPCSGRQHAKAERGHASMWDSGCPCCSQGGEVACGIGSPWRSASSSRVSRSCPSTGVEFWLPATQQDSLRAPQCEAPQLMP